MSEDQGEIPAEKTPWEAYWDKPPTPFGILVGSVIFYFVIWYVLPVIWYVLPVIVGGTLRGAGWAAGAATKTVTEGWASGRR